MDNSEPANHDGDEDVDVHRVRDEAGAKEFGEEEKEVEREGDREAKARDGHRKKSFSVMAFFQR